MKSDTFSLRVDIYGFLLFLDENGIALREDLAQPFQGTIARSRQKARVVTASSSPLLSKVVTSAIRVSNNQPSSGGKFSPNIIDLKVGK